MTFSNELLQQPVEYVVSYVTNVVVFNAKNRPMTVLVIIND